LNLFISFDWDDRYQVNGFRSMLANPMVYPLNHRDTSVKHDYSEFGNQEIKNQILRKIQQSNVTVCLISQKTKNSDWVNWELEQSRRLGKRIVGIILKDQPVVTLQGCPEFFTRYQAFKVYKWDSPENLRRYIDQSTI
jgi:hypothetical protein